MNKNERSFQSGMEMGRKTMSIVRTVLTNHPRKSDETQEQYADRIVFLIGQQLMREVGMSAKTHD